MTNPEIGQDRVADLLSTFDKYGYVMFPQQERIYKNIAQRVYGEILEAGCGNGVGTAILDHYATFPVIGTDKSPRNVQFAKCLYPWMVFHAWDINYPFSLGPDKFDTVVCVECIEHVADPRAAIQHLLDIAVKEVWISTPNGKDKPRPPSNPFHVQEYTTDEMVGMIVDPKGERKIKLSILAWDDFRQLDMNTDVDPLVYHIELL